MLRMAISGAVVAALLIGCGGEGEIGDECDESGQTEDECVDGAICTNESDDANTCRKLCTEQEDCDAGENCNGISGSNLKSCQPD
jgi:hypothetical protein